MACSFIGKNSLLRTLPGDESADVSSMSWKTILPGKRSFPAIIQSREESVQLHTERIVGVINTLYSVP